MADVTMYGTAWCPDCRRAKRFLGEARVDFDWVDVTEDAEAEAFVRRQDAGKLTLPVFAFGDETVLVAPAPGAVAAHLGREAPRERRYFDVVVVGGGPAGLTTALAALREGISCLVLEPGEAGGQADETPRLNGAPGYPDGSTGAEIRETLLTQAHRYGVRILRGDGLGELRPIEGYLEVETVLGEVFVARTVVVATGAVYDLMGIEGEEELRGAGVHFCASCEGPFYRKAEELLVVGGGDLAGEEALFLTGFVDKVRVIEKGAHFTCSPVMLERLRRHPKVELYPSTELTELEIDEGKLIAATVRDRTTGYTFSFNPAAIFAYAGIHPNTGCVDGVLALDDAGFIITNPALQASVPGVFAAGDCRAGSTKQLGPAMAEGSAAALMVSGYLQRLGDLPRRASA